VTILNVIGKPLPRESKGGHGCFVLP